MTPARLYALGELEVGVDPFDDASLRSLGARPALPGVTFGATGRCRTQPVTAPSVTPDKSRG